STPGDGGMIAFMDTLVVPVTFSPAATGTYTANLVVGSSDPDESSYTVVLNGESAEHIILVVPTFFATIQEAIVAAYPEDTVEVLSGTYEESLDLLDKNLVLRSVTGPDSTLIEGDGTGPVLTISGGQSNLTMVNGFTLTGGGGTAGGGIKIDGSSTPVLHHLILSSNAVSGNGGGIAIMSGGADLSFTSISNNTAGGSGGALYAAASASVVLNHSILWDNGNTEIGSFGNVAVSYSIVGGGADGTGNLDLDPLFVNGPGLDFSFQWGSPAIDAGDPSADPDPDGTVADMGALYYDQTNQPPDPPVGLSFVPGSGEVTLSWTANEEADLTHYVVHKGLVPDALDSLAVVAEPAAEYVDSALDHTVINYYALTAVDTASLVSDTSAVLSVSFPSLATSDESLSFGDVRIGEVMTLQLTLSNTGSDTLFVDSIYVSDSLSGFSVALGEMNTSRSLIDRMALSTEVMPGESIGLDVSFMRDDTLTVADELRITSDDPLGNDVVSIGLSGRSVAPVLALAADTLDFGNILAESQLSVMVSNDGTDTLNVSSISFPSGFTGSMAD
ncbi:uncharacterized protein METZ01_LOCUS203029, partial [marine metagenome]